MPLLFCEVMLVLGGIFGLLMGANNEAFPDASVVGAVLLAGGLLLAGLMEIRDELSKIREALSPRDQTPVKNVQKGVTN